MNYMFRNAVAFHFDLSEWCLRAPSSVDYIFEGTTMPEDYRPTRLPHGYVNRYEENFVPLDWPVGATNYREDKDGDPVFNTAQNWNGGYLSSTDDDY